MLFAPKEKAWDQTSSKRLPTRNTVEAGQHSHNLSQPSDLAQRSLGNGYLQSIEQSDMQPEGLGIREDEQLTIQAKLLVGAPDDVYEQEADWVADLVMRMPDPTIQSQILAEEHEKIIRPTVTTEHSGQNQEFSEAPPIVYEVLNSRGRPLDPAIQTFMESRFGQDFSEVRVHTDTKAAESAMEVQALAYTVGREIVFGSGQYTPDTAAGKILLAHELTHTIQQNDNDVSGSRPRIDVAYSADTREQNAVSTANTIQQGQPLSEVISASPAQLARQEEPDDGASKPETFRRVFEPQHPGWVSVTSYKGEPFELPHFIRVKEESESDLKINTTVREGIYAGKDAVIPGSVLISATSSKPSARASFRHMFGDGEFWYGGKGPITAKADPNNPIPMGKHDIEIPDFQHSGSTNGGNYNTTWFRLGHIGGSYLKSGQVSQGSVTITDVSEWPSIWEYLILSRKDDQSVGELEVGYLPTKGEFNLSTFPHGTSKEEDYSEKDNDKTRRKNNERTEKEEISGEIKKLSDIAAGTLSALSTKADVLIGNFIEGAQYAVTNFKSKNFTDEWKDLALGGNLLWAATCLIPPEWKVLIRMMSFIGAYLGTTGGGSTGYSEATAMVSNKMHEKLEVVRTQMGLRTPSIIHSHLGEEGLANFYTIHKDPNEQKHLIWSWLFRVNSEPEKYVIASEAAMLQYLNKYDQETEDFLKKLKDYWTNSFTPSSYTAVWFPFDVSKELETPWFFDASKWEEQTDFPLKDYAGMTAWEINSNPQMKLIIDHPPVSDVFANKRAAKIFSRIVGMLPF